MAIFLYCPRCHKRQTWQARTCLKCGVVIQTNRALRYSIEVRDKAGKKRFRSLGIVSRGHAQEQHMEMVRAINEGEFDGRVLTWGDVVEAYLNKLDQEARGLRYIKANKLYLSRFSAVVGDDAPVSKITGPIIRLFRSSLRGSGLGLCACNRHLAAIKAAWRHSVEDHHNPFRGLPAYNETEARTTAYLTDEQRASLLDAAVSISPQLYNIIIVALGTGLRKRNILELRKDQVDFNAETINVRQKRNRPLEIPLRKSVAAALIRAALDNETEWFFPNPKTGEPYHEDWKKPWLRARETAGLPKGFTFHDLRHDFGTSVYNETRDLKLTQKLLGHSQLSATERYAHVKLDRIKALSDELDHLPLTAGPPTAPTDTPTIFVTDRYDD